VVEGYNLERQIMGLNIILPQTTREYYSATPYDWQAIINFNDLDSAPIPLDLSNYSINSIDFEVAEKITLKSDWHPYSRKVQIEIEPKCYSLRNWSWISEELLSHEYCRYSAYFEWRMQERAMGRNPNTSKPPAELEEKHKTIECEWISTAVSKEISSHDDSVEFPMMLCFPADKTRAPMLVRFSNFSEKEWSLSAGDKIAIASDWDNDGEEWDNLQHFEKASRGLIRKSESILSVESKMNGSRLKFTTPGIYLLIYPKLDIHGVGKEDWFVPKPPNVGDEWLMFKQYEARMEIEVVE